MVFLRAGLLPSLFLLSALFAQERSIRGHILNVENDQPVSGVNIYIENAGIGTTSGDEGQFSLLYRAMDSSRTLVLSHVAFDTLRITIKDARAHLRFYLMPRIIPAQDIVVNSSVKRSRLSDDIPHAIKIIAADEFDGRGFIDLGDLLSSDQAIQIKEDISGKKTLSMRGGNADDVAIFYNGVRMNSSYDNVFDLEMLNIEDIQQVEILRGSNTALFGPEGFSGIINIIPKHEQKYLARFTQKIGSYRSGDWNLNLNYNPFKALHFSFNAKDAARQRFLDAGNGSLKNEDKHFSGHISYDFTPLKSGHKRRLSLLYMNARSRHINDQFEEHINNLNEIYSLRYNGAHGFFKDIDLAVSIQNLNTDQALVSKERLLTRNFINQKKYVNAQNAFDLGLFTVTSAYQFEDAILNYNDDRALGSQLPTGVKKAEIRQQKQGGVAIIKFHSPETGGLIKHADIDLSYRYDRVRNTQRDVLGRDGTFHAGLFRENVWSASTLKLSSQLKGRAEGYLYNLYFNSGTNIKFPTILHQLSTPIRYNPFNPEIIAHLDPEKNRSLEIGFELAREYQKAKIVNGWHIKFNYFENFYENKFRSFYLPQVPAPFFDNVPNANISGIEITIQSELMDKTVFWETGVAKYFITELAAFPFKSDLSLNSSLSYRRDGYNLNIKVFYESDEKGWLRTIDGNLVGLSLPGFVDMDFHLKKWFDVWSFRVMGSISGRNLLNSASLLQGIAIRDRRFYLGFGVEY